MDTETLDWLLGDDNPAVRYRTQTELLGQTGEAGAARDWILSKLPADWFNAKGLWYVYYVTALAECGLAADDVPTGDLNRALENADHDSEYGCADFMLLRALVRLGLHEHDVVKRVIESFHEKSLPDGGFLCARRLKNFSYTPKSCYKADVFALMFLAESRKRNVDVSFGKPLIDYFLNREVFFRSNDRSAAVLSCSTKTFHPFEPMRVGVHNIVESFSALGYGNDDRLRQAWAYLNTYKRESGKHILAETLTKSYLPKEKAGKESKWVTFYALLAEKERLLQAQPENGSSAGNLTG